MNNSNKKMGTPNIAKNIVWAIVSLLLIAVAFSFFMSARQDAPIELSLSELAAEVRAGNVERIEVRNNDLAITLKENNETKDAVANREPDASLSQTLLNFGATEEQVSAAGITYEEEGGFRFWASILIPSLLPLLFIGFLFWFLMKQATRGAGQAFSFGKSTARLFTQFKDKVTFKDVAGLTEVKEELHEIVDFLSHPKKFLEIGARIPRGVLLVGPPGTGKTLLARAVAGEANVPFFHISGSEFVEMFVGVGASRVRDLFETAKKSAPAIIFIDEIDAVGRQRGAGLGGGHDEREQTLNQILVEMDGFDRESQVIIVAATNRPDILDPALLRPGRFDRRVVLDLPDINEREAILTIHAKGKPLTEDVDLRRVATRTPGFSGADLANIVNEAAILAARKDEKIISQDAFYEAIEKVLLGPERKSRVINEKEREITAYHEAGHALVASSLKDADPVHKVSIIARGRAGGYTLKLPTEDRTLKTRNQFLADLAVYLGGYAAEQVVFREFSTGASNDLREATKLARKLVTKYGMSEKLGPVTFGTSEELVFLGKDIAHEKEYSERVAGEIDDEVSRFITNALQTAKKIVTKRRKVLNAIADQLMEKETLEQEEYKSIVDKFKLKPLAV